MAAREDRETGALRILNQESERSGFYYCFSEVTQLEDKVTLLSNHWPIAQLVERIAVNDHVLGSSPSGPVDNLIHLR